MDRPPTDVHGSAPGAAARALAAERSGALAAGEAILATSRRLLDAQREGGYAQFQADLEKIYRSAFRLNEMLGDSLDPGQHDEADPEALRRLQSRIRHDMLNALNAVINYCEMWLEDADEASVPTADLPQLREIHAQGKHCLMLLDHILSERVFDAVPANRAAPAPIEHAESRRKAVGVAPADQAGSLLVVDDNENNRDILCRMLERQGHMVAVAVNGKQALEMLHAQQFDVVLLDVLMPEMDGFQVLEHMKADTRLRELPVIMISALDQDDSVIRCIAMGAEDYLPKPFNPLLLQARLNVCLDKKRFRDRERLYLSEIDAQRRRADELLHVILPREVVTELKATNAVQPRRHDRVAVLFADIKNFTPYCDGHDPTDVVCHLQRLVELWEESSLRHGVEKIKTIGDAFMAASGLLKPAENAVLNCVRCGEEMIAATRAMGTGWDLRVGVHCGPVVAGVIGRRQYLFDLWGDTVNTAARMESHGIPGSITLSRTAWAEVEHLAEGESLVVSVKGKGNLEMIRFREFRR